MGVSNKIKWAIPGILAGSSRPGYGSENVDLEAVSEWVGAVKKQGIKSIICLLDEHQLGFYQKAFSDLDDGLLGYYRQQGFEVAHVSVEDHKTPPLSEKELENVYTKFKKLQKPTLIHCSAGAQRTGRAVDYIKDRMG